MMNNDLPWCSPLEMMISKSIDSAESSLNIVFNRPQRDPQVLFLHGVLRNWRSFYTLLPKLDQSNVSVAALDFRGHGNSSPRPNAYWVRDYVDDAVLTLQSLKNPVVVYGHSLGAMVAMAAAALVPDRVRSIILEDPPFETMGGDLVGSSLHTYFVGVAKCIETPPANQESLFRDFSNIQVGLKPDGTPLRVSDQRDETSRRFSSQCLFTTDSDVLKPITEGRWLDGFDWRNVISNLQCQVQLLQADKKMGGMLTSTDASFFADTLGAQCHLASFPGIGHSIHWQRADDVLSLIHESVAAA